MFRRCRSPGKANPLSCSDRAVSVRRAIAPPIASVKANELRPHLFMSDTVSRSTGRTTFTARPASVYTHPGGFATVRVMAVRPPSSPAPPGTGARPRRWTRKEYHRAAELGIFRPDERLDLLDGEIIQKMAPGGPYAAVVSRSDRILAEAFGPGCHTR